MGVIALNIAGHSIHPVVWVKRGRGHEGGAPVHWLKPARRTARPPPGCSGSTLAARRVGERDHTVHLSYVREGTGHALIGARQRVPADRITDPVRSLQMALPPNHQFATKGQLATAFVAGALADGVHVDFVCDDVAYGSCTQQSDYLGVTPTCAQAVRGL